MLLSCRVICKPVSEKRFGRTRTETHGPCVVSEFLERYRGTFLQRERPLDSPAKVGCRLGPHCGLILPETRSVESFAWFQMQPLRKLCWNSWSNRYRNPSAR